MDNIQKKLVKILSKKKIKLSFAESCTGGLLSSTITSVKGSSKIFTLGLIVYSNKSKIDILKVPKKILNKHGAVSKEVCLAMVKNLSKISKTQIAVSVTGIAGPNGGTKSKPVGLVYAAFKIKKLLIIKKFLFKNQKRIIIQKKTVAKVLNIILNKVR